MKITKSKGLIEAQKKREELVERYEGFQDQLKETQESVDSLKKDIQRAEITYREKLQQVVAKKAKPEDAAKLKKPVAELRGQYEDLCDLGEALVEAIKGLSKHLEDSLNKVNYEEKRCLIEIADNNEWLSLTDAVEDYILQSMLRSGSAGGSIDGAKYSLELILGDAGKTAPQRYKDILKQLAEQPKIELVSPKKAEA